jgi:hypothetical protein
MSKNGHEILEALGIDTKECIEATIAFAYDKPPIITAKFRIHQVDGRLGHEDEFKTIAKQYKLIPE